MRGVFLCLVLLLSVWTQPNANAHDVRPAYLEFKEVAPERYEILWKVPILGIGKRPEMELRLPLGTERVSPTRALVQGGASIERWVFRRPGGLDGCLIRVEGLATAGVDVLVRLERLEGLTQAALLTFSSPEFTVAMMPSAWEVASTYTWLGAEHILLGVDHLLFVFALVLLVRGWKRLVGTITSFTVAHSLTLAAATVGVLHVPGPPVEASIALSIVFVAAEILRSESGRRDLTARFPWMIAFIFGLLHGLGFAGALSEVGLPARAIPLALLLFNVGVELGQLVFIGLVLGIATGLRRVKIPTPDWVRRIMPYAIGSTAMFWVIQRVQAFFS